MLTTPEERKNSAKTVQKQSITNAKRQRKSITQKQQTAYGKNHQQTGRLQAPPGNFRLNFRHNKTHTAQCLEIVVNLGG